ncbi:MAG: amino acid permease [Gemmatimonadaceae bacterium]|nr:amino acid permease [Gemmatimonadaceae bacterium]
MPPESDTPSAAGEQGFVRAIGVVGLAAGIVNITIGGGIFRLPAEVSRTLGAAAPLGYLVCAVAMAIIVLCIADAGSRVALTGGPYAYIETAFGPFVGYLGGVVLWLLSTFAMAAVSTVFADNVGALVPLVRGPLGRTAFYVALFGFFAAVNVRGVTQGTRLNNVATVAKILPLLLLAVFGWVGVKAEHLVVQEWPDATTLARTAILLTFAFSGIESALVPGGEVRDPARTVPRAIFLAMGGITVLYLLLQFVSRGILGEGLSAATTAPLAAAAGQAMGSWARTLLLVGASVSMFGHAGGMMLALSRVLYALARDGFLPKVVASVHPIHRTPHIAIVLQAVAAIVLAATNTFERLAVLANISVLMLYGACCVASWQLRRTGVRQGGTPFRSPAPAVLPWLGVLVIGWMFTSIRPGEWLAILVALSVATALYLATRARRRLAAP